MDYLIPILIFAGIGVVAGVVLTVAGRLFHVEKDETVEKLKKLFPGINCGACGFANCERYAQAIANEGAAPGQCKPGGVAVAEKVGEVLGKTVQNAEAESAFVMCAGDCVEKYDYLGTESCRSSAMYYGGKESCNYGCSGLGDCVRACPENAIRIVNRRAVVTESLCNACGLCVKSCPKNIIKIQKISQSVNVTCCSKDKGVITKSVCSKGCIGCKICEKKCASKAILVRDNVASINPELCTNCGDCVSVCPVKCIAVKPVCEFKQSDE